MSDRSPDQQLQELSRDHEAAKAKLKSLVMVGRVLSIVMVVVLVGSLFMLYGKVTTMYAPENFEEPLRQEAENLIPVLEPELRTLWEETAPTYASLARAKLDTVLPDIQEASQRELDALLQNLQLNVEQRTNQALQRIYTKHDSRLREQFPRLANEDSADDLVLQWAENIESDFGEIVAHFEARCSEDLGHLQATFEQFRSSSLESMSRDELTRHFAHLWLMKVDHWVVTGDQGNTFRYAEGVGS